MLKGKWWNRLWIRFYEGDDDEGGGGDGDAGKGNFASKDDVSALGESVKLLGQGLASIQDSLKDLSSRSGVDNDGDGGDNGKDGDSDGGKDDDVDLDTLGNKELAGVLVSRLTRLFDKKIEQALKPTHELSERMTQAEAREQIKELAAKAPDLRDWAGEIQAKLKDRPALSIEEAYQLVKLENPKKDSELKAKAKAEEEEKNKGSQTGRGFGGLPPRGSTSGGSGKGSDKDSKMTIDKASEAAWEATQAAFGDILNS